MEKILKSAFIQQFVWSKKKTLPTIVILASVSCVLFDFSSIVIAKHIHNISPISARLILVIEIAIGLMATALELYNPHAGLEAFLLWPSILPLAIYRLRPEIVNLNIFIDYALTIGVTAFAIRCLIMVAIDSFNKKLIDKIRFNPLLIFIPIFNLIKIDAENTLNIIIDISYLGIIIITVGNVLGLILRLINIFNRKIYYFITKSTTIVHLNNKAAE